MPLSPVSPADTPAQTYQHLNDAIANLQRVLDSGVLNQPATLTAQQITSLNGLVGELRLIGEDNRGTAEGALAAAGLAEALAAQSVALRQSRPGDAPAAYSRTLVSGPATARPALDPASLSTDASGATALLVGPDAVGRRDMIAIEPGRTYRVRAKLYRAAVSADPASDAVNVALAVFDRYGARSGADILLGQALALTPSSGVYELTRTVARSAGTGIDAVVGGDAQVYGLPYVQQFGSPSTVTHLEVLAWEDITDAETWSPDLTSLTGRVGTLESQNAGPRLTALESAVSAPETRLFTSIAEAQAATIAGTVNYLNVRGLLFARAAAGDFQSADGAWWQVASVVTQQATGPVLTLAQGNPVPTLEYTAATTLYATPGQCDLLGLYDGSLWIGHRLAEVGIPLDTSYGASTTYSVFAYLGASRVAYGTFPWSSATSPGTGAGTSELELFEGRWVNRNPIALRLGSATTTIPARQALYIGAFGTTAIGQTEDSFTHRLVSSVYDTRAREMKRHDPAFSWVYSGAAFVLANNGNGLNRLEYLHCLPGRSIEVEVVDSCFTNTTTPIAVSCNIGLDSLAPIADIVHGAALTSPGDTEGMSARWSGAPGQGRHVLNWLEYAAYDPAVHTGTAQTWAGTEGTFQSGITAWI